MATKKEAAPLQAEGAEPAIRPAYTRDELLSSAAALFAVKPEVVTGALYGTDKSAYTIEETERLIRQFQTRKVLS
ncbi:hypothetical protein [Paenibacillus sp. GYB003]|uniref:hypothetical protein n=1 Tax=Paenibacillus sp. GYB003 TaxID=2994392 RepID=UPI002F961A56